MRKILSISVLFILFIMLIAYTVWLCSGAAFVKDAILLYTDHQKKIQFKHPNDPDRNIKLFNFKRDFFFLKKGFKPFQKSYNPFRKTIPTEEKVFDIYITSSYADAYNTIVLDTLEMRVNAILDFLHVGYRVSFNEIQIFKDTIPININYIYKKTTHIKSYLSQLGIHTHETNNSLIISHKISKHDDSSTQNSLDEEYGSSHINYLGQQFIFVYDPNIIFDPLLFVHELLHYASGKIFEHIYEGPSCGIFHIMSENITPCHIIIFANDLLELSQGTKFDSTVAKRIWPFHMDTVCCPATIPKDFFFNENFFTLIHEEDVLRNIVDRDSVKMLEDIIRLYKDEVFDTSAFAEAIRIESRVLNIPASQKYIAERLSVAKALMVRNAKLWLNHKMVNKKELPDLRLSSFEDLLNEFFGENFENPFYKKMYFGAFNKDIYYKFTYKEGNNFYTKVKKAVNNRINIKNGHRIQVGASDSLFWYQNNTMKKTLNTHFLTLDSLQILDTLVISSVPVCNETIYCFNIQSPFKMHSIKSVDNIQSAKFSNGFYCFQVKLPNILINYEIKEIPQDSIVKIQSQNFTKQGLCKYVYNSSIEIK